MEDLEISCADLSAALQTGKTIRLVDCREPWEHEIVSLPDAELIPMNETPERIGDYRSGEGLCVVYCHHGVRSLNVAAWLRQQGLDNVRSLAGGIDGWSLLIDPSLPRY